MRILRKGLKILLILVGALIAVFLLVNAALVWITGSRLEARLKVLQDAGEPLCLRALAAPSIPPEQNAATYLQRAQSDITAASQALNLLDEQKKDDPEAIGAVLNAHPQLFPLLEQALACRDYQGDADFTLGTTEFVHNQIKRAQEFRKVTNLFEARSQMQLAAGRRDDALKSTTGMLRLARLFQREPMLISYLFVLACRSVGVHAANRVLRTGPVSPMARASLEAELAEVDSAAECEYILKTERAYALDCFRETFPVIWANRAFFNEQECAYLDVIAEQLALGSQTFAQAQPSFAIYHVEPRPWRHIFALQILPAIEKVHGARCRVDALVRCLRVLNALQQRPAAAGFDSSSLTQLGLPAKATVDPFTGASLLVRKVASEWVIYSVGANLVDDGGKLDQLEDVGLGPVAAK